jgi:hypothetical protein
MRKIKPVLMLVAVTALVVTGLFMSGCATLGPEKPKDVVRTDRGTAVYQEKYEFKIPPAGWNMLKNLEGGDFELGFMRFEKGDYPSQTTFIFDDEPFGSSQDLDQRAKQYCTRFLFNSGVIADVKKQEKTEVLGLPAIALYLEGENPNRNEKAKSKIYLIKKGNRIISFLCTQWRPFNGIYDPSGFDPFEEFVKSFKFLKKSFYENFEDELQKAGL